MRWIVRGLTSQSSASRSCVSPFCWRSSATLSPRSGWFMVYSFRNSIPSIGTALGITTACARHSYDICFLDTTIRFTSTAHKEIGDDKSQEQEADQRQTNDNAQFLSLLLLFGEWTNVVLVLLLQRGANARADGDSNGNPYTNVFKERTKCHTYRDADAETDAHPVTFG